jgi:hypothetical protein
MAQPRALPQQTPLPDQLPSTLSSSQVRLITQHLHTAQGIVL